MIEPISIFKYLKQSSKVMREEYKPFILIFNFLVIPLLFSLIFTLLLIEPIFKMIIDSSIPFFSIIVGFLINVLVLLINTKKITKKEMESLSKNEITFENIKERLRRNLSYAVLTNIFFGFFLIIVIIFYPALNFGVDFFKPIILFMFGHFIVLLSNILLKFGAYIMSIFEK
jgi:hypothetical protein